MTNVNSIFDDAPLSFREFVMNESVPLGQIHQTVLKFLKERTDVVLFGAQAVNAYVDSPRMTEDIDIMTVHAESLSNELCQHIHAVHHIAVRVREVANGKGFRIYQLRSPTNRHLVDIRQVESLPKYQVIDKIWVVAPVDLIALKVISLAARPHTPKGQTDQADLMRLLITYPELKSNANTVLELLLEQAASPNAIQTWQELVQRDIQPDVDDY